MGIKDVATRIMEKFSGTRPGTVVQPCPCTPDPTNTYRDYYAKPFADFYDAQAPENDGRTAFFCERSRRYVPGFYHM